MEKHNTKSLEDQLREIKKQVAEKRDSISWNYLKNNCGAHYMEEVMDEVCKLYASSLTQQVEELTKKIELLNIRDSKREKKFELINKENGALHARVEELTREKDKLKIELSNYAYQIDRAKRDRDKAESELEELKKEAEDLSNENDELHNSLLQKTNHIIDLTTDMNRYREALRKIVTENDTKFDYRIPYWAEQIISASLNSPVKQGEWWDKTKEEDFENFTGAKQGE